MDKPKKYEDMSKEDLIKAGKKIIDAIQETLKRSEG